MPIHLIKCRFTFRFVWHITYPTQTCKKEIYCTLSVSLCHNLQGHFLGALRHQSGLQRSTWVFFFGFAVKNFLTTSSIPTIWRRKEISGIWTFAEMVLGCLICFASSEIDLNMLMMSRQVGRAVRSSLPSPVVRNKTQVFHKLRRSDPFLLQLRRLISIFRS